MSLKLITAPDPILTVDEMKAHLRVDYDDEDDLITSLVGAAISYLDGWKGALGRALGLQTWELVLDCFPCAAIRIPFGPLSSITSVKYDDADGDEQTVDPADYDVDDASSPGWVVPVSGFSWPSTLAAINAVRVRFVAGSATIDPADLAIVKLLVANWYENREAVNVGQSVADLPFAVQALMGVRRVITI